MPVLGCAGSNRATFMRYETGVFGIQVADGPRRTFQLQPVETPSHAVEYFHAAVGALGLGGMVDLVTVESADSAGQFMIDAGRGLVVLALHESEALADEIWRGNFTPVHPRQVEDLLANGVLVLRRGRLLESVRESIIGHELGHALAAVAGRDAPVTVEECEADYWAGFIDMLMGNDQRLGEVLFRSIGCLGASCEHPPPHVRRSVYAHGFQDALAEMLASQSPHDIYGIPRH